MGSWLSRLSLFQARFKLLLPYTLNTMRWLPHRLLWSSFKEQPPLDITFYSYPWGQCATISRVFSEAEIPHILWGDQVLTFHGANQVILMVAILIPDDKLSRAITLLVNSGLTHCPCRDDMTHFSDPFFKNDLPAHFRSSGGLIHLCTSSMLLDQVPLVDNHPNPLNLSFIQVEVPLLRNTAEPFSLMKSAGDRPTDVYSAVDNHTVRLLDERSLVTIILYMKHCNENGVTEQAGIGLTWFPALAMVASYLDQDHDILRTMPPGPLRSDYLSMKRILYPDRLLE